MITCYGASGQQLPLDLASGALPQGSVFIDLLHGDPAEIAFVERATGLKLPSTHQLSEVEASSRLSIQGDALVVTTPVVYRREDGEVSSCPVGFVLTEQLLVTIRSTDLRAFADYFARGPVKLRQPEHGGVEVFLSLLEIMVDRMADAMEQVGNDLESTSNRIFSIAKVDEKKLKPIRMERRLTRTLTTIGMSGELTSQARNSLLGLGRLVGYVATHATDWLSPNAKTRLETLKQDIASLNEFETRLTDKVQFLLDSTLGFINIEQNRTFKILTIASVVGIPPTFVVGLYGMNFKGMPEYDWTYGYPFGLAMILLSIIIPTTWLKWRGWF